MAEPDARVDVPPAAEPETVRTLYVFEGSVRIDDRDVDAPTGRCCASTRRSTIAAGPAGAEALVLQGRPIGEPVAQYGPFVMNDRGGYRAGVRRLPGDRFGGWPWPADDPVHARDADRFADVRDPSVR